MSGLQTLQGDGAPSRTPQVLGALALVLLLLGGLYAGLQYWIANLVPADTSVAGVGIGGLNREEAIVELQTRLGPRADAPVNLRAGDARATLDPAEAGLTFDATATVDALTGFSWHPSRLWNHLTGSNTAEPAVRIDRTALLQATTDLADSLTTEPQDGNVALNGTDVTVTDPVTGKHLDAQGAADVIAENWLRTADPIEVPTEILEPAIGQEATDAAADKARAIVSGPVRLTVTNAPLGPEGAALPDPTIAAADMAAATTITPNAPGFDFALDGEALAAYLVSRNPDLIAESEDAFFAFADPTDPNTPPAIEGGQPGTSFDPAELAAELLHAVSVDGEGGFRTAEVTLVEVDPPTSRADLEALGVVDVVAAFSTPLTADTVRTANIARGGEILTGRLLRPLDRFSMLESLAPISTDNGFNASPVITDGMYVQGIGGGLSQLTTNMFNGAFFAGFEIIEHRPHSVWLPRYPAGREATLYIGEIDLVFRNQTEYGAVIQSWVAADNTAHVQIWSTDHLRVETTASERTGYTPIGTAQRSGPDCVPFGGGEAGFTITNTRQVFRGDTLLIDEAFPWTYSPHNAIVCN